MIRLDLGDFEWMNISLDFIIKASFGKFLSIEVGCFDLCFERISGNMEDELEVDW